MNSRWQAWLILIGAAMVAAIVVGSILWDAVKPPPLVWVQTDTPRVALDRLIVTAKAQREPVEGCSNGAQMEMVDAGQIVRLPVPTRVIAGGTSTYTTELLRPLNRGRYTVRVVEVFNCGGRPKLIASPWLVFEVL